MLKEANSAVFNLGSGAVRVIPDDRILLLPAPVSPDDPDGTDLGATFWGTTLEASDPRYNIEDAEQPGIVAGTYRDDDPLGVDGFATHHLDLADAPRGYEIFQKKIDGAVKVVLRP